MSRVRRVIDLMPAWGYTLLTTVLILWLTLARKPLGDTEIELFPGADKVVHAIMFGWLSAMIVLDRTRSHGWRAAGVIFIIAAAAVSTLFGIGIEFAQDAMGEGRSFDPGDMVADGAGAIIAGIIWYLLRGDFNGREQHSRTGETK